MVRSMFSGTQGYLPRDCGVLRITVGNDALTDITVAVHKEGDRNFIFFDEGFISLWSRSL